MFGRKWSHGHSIGTGVLVGLLVSQRPEIVFVAGFACAFLVLGGIKLTRHLFTWLEDRKRRRQFGQMHKESEQMQKEFEWEETPTRSFRRF